MQLVAKRSKAREVSRTFTMRLVRCLWILGAVAGVAVFAVMIARLTLRPVPGAAGQIHDNPHPGATLRFYLDRPSIRTAVLEIGGNLALLMPLGLLLPALFRGMRGPLRVTGAVAAVSLAIELAQGLVVTGRTFDIDDVILNTVGALLAYVGLGRRIGRWAHPSRGTPASE